MPAADTSRTEATIRRLYEAMSSGDVADVDGILTPDWEDVPHSAHSSPGVHGFKELVAYLHAAFPDLSVTIEDVLVDGDRAAVRSVARGTHSAEVLGIPATGRTVEYRASDFHRLDEDGRIAVTWHLEDFFGLANQLGATLRPA